MPAANTPFTPVAQCDEIPSTSCTEDEALHVREPPARPRGVWKVAVVATVTGLIAAAGTWWSQSETLGSDVGEQAVGLATWAMYGHIGCSNWASIEISRSQVADQEECAKKCTDTADCTMYNWQEDACEPGWPKANGCLLFKGSCSTQRNVCWQLNYKIDDVETVVTQAVTVETSATKAEAEAAVAAALADEGIKPVTTTATKQRRLQAQDRNLAQVKIWVVTWTFKTTNTAKGDAAYDFAVSMLTTASVATKFSLNAKKALPAGSTFFITNVGEPVKESGGTTETPDFGSTTA